MNARAICSHNRVHPFTVWSAPRHSGSLRSVTVVVGRVR